MQAKAVGRSPQVEGDYRLSDVRCGISVAYVQDASVKFWLVANTKNREMAESARRRVRITQSCVISELHVCESRNEVGLCKAKRQETIRAQSLSHA